ncbi:acyl carrier protein [Nocardia vermiculata]|uniref:Acyl carrier protein n=1 Tax=Nocardia vermiculata TaxID=257274 RepID=A0A846XQH0_9NOCA|nr:acyl carrier protein [Nocardia vermiculata]NKY48867.1 acyl carrier protein [Nocardia vermiculata]
MPHPSPETHAESSTAEVVRQLLSQELRTTVELDQVIVDLPEIESVKFMRLITRIEDRLDITLDDEQVFAAVTVGDLAAVVDAVRGHNPVAGQSE